MPLDTPIGVKQQLKAVESVGVVTDGKIVGEYDFYHYLEAMEGKTIRWSLALDCVDQ
jgi:hypothetical protein